MKDHEKSGVEPCRSAETVGKAGDDGQGALVERLRDGVSRPTTILERERIADCLEALTRENAALRADKERLRTFAHEATKAITGLTAGGSEYLSGEVDGIYLADLPLCAERIRARFATPKQKAAEANAPDLPATPPSPEPDAELAGGIAYALTKRLVIDMPTARAAVDEALRRHRKQGEPIDAEVERADFLTEIGRSLPEDFPNYAVWPITLPAGHWRRLAALLSKGGENV